MKHYICCFSGGKDSTAMLIHILENDLPLDEVLYVDVGDWIWDSAKSHIEEVEKKFGITITILDITNELKKGFERWGFPSFLNRWCTGEKRTAMQNYLKEKYGERERALYNTSDIVVMKKKEPQRSYITVMKFHILWSMQILQHLMLYRCVMIMDLTLVEYMNIIVILTVGYVLYKGKESYIPYSKIIRTIGKSYELCNIQQMEHTILMKQSLTVKNNFGKRTSMN